MKNASRRGVLTLAIQLGSFGSPKGFPNPHFGSVSVIFTFFQKWGCNINPKDQKNTLIKTRISYGLFVSLREEDGIPFALMHCTHETSTSWACCHIKTVQLANVTSTTITTNTSLVVFPTIKQITQYNKYCI
jgi:hypothetical protein